MNFTEFTDLIGKDIFEAHKLIEEDFNIDPESNNLYWSQK